MLGYGGRVVFCQFLKGAPSGELEPLEKLGADIIRAKKSGKFLFQMNADEKAVETKAHRRCFERVSALVADGGVDLLVLDEVVDAVNAGLIPEGMLISLVANKPASLEIVLTGRKPSPQIEALADYYTGFDCLRHPYKKGTQARAGIEY
jgi:cob(I)alamin adenosyltransferase